MIKYLSNSIFYRRPDAPIPMLSFSVQYFFYSLALTVWKLFILDEEQSPVAKG